MTESITEVSSSNSSTELRNNTMDPMFVSYPKNSVGKEIRIDFGLFSESVVALSSEHILTQQASLLSAFFGVCIGQVQFDTSTGEMALHFSEPCSKSVASLVADMSLSVSNIKAVEELGIDLDIPTMVLDFVAATNLNMRVRIVPEDTDLDVYQYVYSDLNIEGIKNGVFEEHGHLLTTTILGRFIEPENYFNVTKILTDGSMEDVENPDKDCDYSNIVSTLVTEYKESSEGLPKLISTSVNFSQWLRKIDNGSTTTNEEKEENTEQQYKVNSKKDDILRTLVAIAAGSEPSYNGRTRVEGHKASAPKVNTKAQANNIRKRRKAKKLAKRSKQRNRT